MDDCRLTIEKQRLLGPDVSIGNQQSGGKPQARKTRVAHTSRRSLAGCMRPLERGADMPNYGTSAPPLIFIKFRGPKA
jgi:hypothetical protein